MEGAEDALIESVTEFVKEIVPSRNATLVNKGVVPVAKVVLKEALTCIKNNNPFTLNDKLHHLTNFIKHSQADSIQDIVISINDHWNPFWVRYGNGKTNPLGSVGGIENVNELKELVASEVKKICGDIFTKNCYAQGGVIALQYVLLTYLIIEAQSNGTVISNIEDKLAEIKRDYISPAFELMHKQNDQDDEKRAEWNMNMSPTDSKMACTLLKCAQDRIRDCILMIEDKKTQSRNLGLLSVGLTLVSSYFVSGIYSGYKSLSDVPEIAKNVLCTQQQVFTGLAAGGTVGLAGAAIAHGWNYKRCVYLLDGLNQMEKEVTDERKKLSEIQGLIMTHMSRNL